MSILNALNAMPTLAQEHRASSQPAKVNYLQNQISHAVHLYIL